MGKKGLFLSKISSLFFQGNVPNVQHFFGEFRCCSLDATGVVYIISWFRNDSLAYALETRLIEAGVKIHYFCFTIAILLKVFIKMDRLPGTYYHIQLYLRNSASLAILILLFQTRLRFTIPPRLKPNIRYPIAFFGGRILTKRGLRKKFI